MLPSTIYLSGVQHGPNQIPQSTQGGVLAGRQRDVRVPGSLVRAHPAATFEELEQELRQQRRELMGGTLATLIVGRDSGYQPSAPSCPQCGQPMTFEAYRPWTVKGLEKGIVFWNGPTMAAQCVLGRLFPPLDQKLALRADHWSGGAARVATRLGLQAKSFDLAAAGFSDAVGRDISGDSVARLTEAQHG